MDIAKKYTTLLKRYKELQSKNEQLEQEFILYKKQTEQSYTAAKELIADLQAIKQEWAEQLTELKQQKDKCVELNRSLKRAVQIATRYKNKR